MKDVFKPIVLYQFICTMDISMILSTPISGIISITIENSETKAQCVVYIDIFIW